MFTESPTCKKERY